MPYQVTIVAEDGTATEVQEAPAAFEIEWDADQHVWRVCLTWDRESLADPDDEDVLASAWPTTSSVKVWSRREELFFGPVTKVGDKADHFYIEAATERSETPDPSNDMLITVGAAEPGSHDVLITVDNRGEGVVALNFGDGTDSVENAGDGSAVTAHTYVQTGTYTVLGTDVTNTERIGRATVVIPQPEGS